MGTKASRLVCQPNGNKEVNQLKRLALERRRRKRRGYDLTEMEGRWVMLAGEKSCSRRRRCSEGIS